MKGAIFLAAGASAFSLSDVVSRRTGVVEVTCAGLTVPCTADCDMKCEEVEEIYAAGFGDTMTLDQICVDPSTQEADWSCKEDCFPGDAMVMKFPGTPTKMSELIVGDKVLTSNGYQDVYFFTHVEKETSVEYHEISTASGKKIHISAGHLIHLNGDTPVAAHLASPGHTVTLANGETDEIVSVTKVMKKGLYAPQTFTNDIVVDGVLASTFTDIASTSTQAMFLAPMEMLYRMGGASWMGRAADKAVPQWLRNVALSLKK